MSTDTRTDQQIGTGTPPDADLSIQDAWRRGWEAAQLSDQALHEDPEMDRKLRSDHERRVLEEHLEAERAKVVEIDATARRLLDEALSVIWEKEALITVLGAGYDPLRGGGHLVARAIRDDIRAGTLEPSRVTHRTVHDYARRLGIRPEFEPVTPRFEIIEGGNTP